MCLGCFDAVVGKSTMIFTCSGKVRLGSLSSNVAVVGDVGSNPSVALNGDIVIDVEAGALIANSTLVRC
jgi:uncharacterized metal-binding protein